MSYNYAVFEIFEALDGLTDRQPRIDSLKTVPGDFKMLLQMWLDDNIKFRLPEGAPPYTPNIDAVTSHMSMWGQIRRLNIFMDGMGYENLEDRKRESICSQMLSQIHPKDAVILSEFLQKNHKEWPWKNLTKDDIREAFGW